MALHDGVREYPHPSRRYRDRFNAVAGELELGLRWVTDQEHPNAVDAAELQLEDGTTPQQLTPELVKQIRRVLEEVETRRLAVVQESALHHRRVPYRAPLEYLRPVERQAVQLMHDEVKPALNRIEARQQDPRADQQGAWLSRHGDFYSRQLWQRFHHDQGAGAQNFDPALSLLPFFPDQPPINGMLDPALTLEQFRARTASLPADAEELRPTTALDANFEPIPLPVHPDFRYDHLKLARALEKVANLEVEGESLPVALSSQLKHWARFFRTGRAEDEKAAVQSTIDAGEADGGLRIHLGPSESYWPDNTKFPYLLQVGVRDPELTARLKEWQHTFPALEQSLSDVPHYEPRPLNTRGGFADPMYQAVTGGFIETFFGREPRGSNFPNYNYGTEGSNRFINLETLPPIVDHVQTVASRLLDEQLSQARLDRFLGDVALFATGHESGHLIGPQRDHITPSGERMGAVFGEHWGSADEPKADLTSLEMVAMRYRAGEISRQELESVYRASLGFMLTLYPGKAPFQEGKAHNHAFGYMIETGYYFQAGALSLNGDRIRVDYDKMQTASHDLWKQLIALQAAGDREGFLALSQACVAAIPDPADQAIVRAQEGWREYFVERHL